MGNDGTTTVRVTSETLADLKKRKEEQGHNSLDECVSELLDAVETAETLADVSSDGDGISEEVLRYSVARQQQRIETLERELEESLRRLRLVEEISQSGEPEALNAPPVELGDADVDGSVGQHTEKKR